MSDTAAEFVQGWRDAMLENKVLEHRAMRYQLTPWHDGYWAGMAWRDGWQYTSSNRRALTTVLKTYYLETVEYRRRGCSSKSSPK